MVSPLSNCDGAGSHFAQTSGSRWVGGCWEHVDIAWVGRCQSALPVRDESGCLQDRAQRRCFKAVQTLCVLGYWSSEVLVRQANRPFWLGCPRDQATLSDATSPTHDEMTGLDRLDVDVLHLIRRCTTIKKTGGGCHRFRLSQKGRITQLRDENLQAQ